MLSVLRHVWDCRLAVVLYGGPVCILAAIVLGVTVLAFHVRAPWVLWTLAATGVLGVTWAIVMADYFRHLARM